VIRKTAKANGQRVPSEASQDPAILAMRINALEEGLERMVQAQQLNHTELRKAFHMTDAHLYVLKKLAEDSAAGELVFVSEGDVVTSKLDWKHYYELFNELQRKAAEEAEQMKEAELKAAEEKAKEAEPQAEVFGGEQANV
jgi:hypothetical protein